MLKKFLVSLFASASLLLMAAPAYASTPLSGWAWSSTIGWVSFNSADSGAGGGPYSVQLSTTTGSNVGTLSGYAWSPNIGWVQFGGLAGQTVNGQTTSDMTVDMSTGNVTGWARACAGTATGNCSTMTSRTDGWDGWIELSGANHQSGGKFQNWRLGSDIRSFYRPIHRLRLGRFRRRVARFHARRGGVRIKGMFE